jgi:hypothetical protein
MKNDAVFKVRFNPQSDITTFELARIVDLLIAANTGQIHSVSEAFRLFNELPEGSHRHFNILLDEITNQLQNKADNQQSKP